MLSSLFILVYFIPFELKYYHELSPLSYLFQFLLTPLFICFAISGLLAFYGIPIFKITEFFAFGIKRVSGWLVKILFTLFAPTMAPIIMLIFNVLYFISLYYISIGFKPIYRVTCLTFFSILLLYILPIKITFTNEVSFINVGQGDACLIRKQNTSILIDTGGSKYTDIATECLIPYINSNYSTYTDREHTAISGFSMGGREALYIGITKPKVFGYIGCACPAPGVTPAQDNFMVHPGNMQPGETITVACDDYLQKQSLSVMCSLALKRRPREDVAKYSYISSPSGTGYVVNITAVKA